MPSFSLVLFSTVAKAQQTIRGWITDEQRSPIEYANVIALSVRDSSLVTGAVTDNAGKFLLSLPSNSVQVFLRVSGIATNSAMFRCLCRRYPIVKV